MSMIAGTLYGKGTLMAALWVKKSSDAAAAAAEAEAAAAAAQAEGTAGAAGVYLHCEAMQKGLL